MLKRITVPALVILLSLVSAYGGEDPARLVVDGARAKAYVAHLSADALEGRASCTEGYRKAAEWVAAQFQAWGLKPAGEEGTYFQKVSIPGFDWNAGTPALTVAGRAFPLDDGDYSVDPPSTPATTQQGEIVFVGYGIAAPGKGLDEYQGVDVKGKIVLVLRGSPQDAPPLRRPFQSPEEPAKTDVQEDPWKEESTNLSKIKAAYEKGAAAVLLYDIGGPPEGSTPPRRPPRRSAPPTFKPERNFLCFTIQERVFRAIMRQDPQQSPQGLRRSIDAIRREIQQKRAQSRTTGVQAVLKGYDVSTRYDEQHGNNVARNVLAKIEGTDPELKNQYVLVGAHLDHLGVRGGYVYNGADDDASGCGVVLEVARALSEGKFQPKRTLIFCCWCGEERGLLGSLHYTNRPCDGVTMDKVVACFNLDMVGMGEGLDAMGALNFPTIWQVIQRNQDPDLLKRIKPSQGGPSGSDHTGFIKRGIEAVFLMSRDGVGHQDYHQPEDDTERIEPEMLRRTGQFVLQGMVNLADETAEKLLIERREQLYRAMRMEISNLNPDLPNSTWTYVDIKEKTKEALHDQLYDRARELFRGTSPADAGGPARAAGQGPRAQKSLTRGLANFQAIGEDVRLLELAVDFYGIGRVDIKGDDGVWVVNGRLTDVGREALKSLEANDVVVRLVSPGEKLIDDMLSAASRPLVITGDYQITYALAERLNAGGVHLGIDLDPEKVGDFITRVEKATNLLGERRNLFAFLTAAKGLEEAKQPLYLGLIDRGWTHNEICGGREHRGLLGGGNLGTPGRRANRSR